jgi:hypothetical protein
LIKPKVPIPPEVEAWVVWVKRAHKLWCKQIHKFHTSGPGYWNLSQESIIAFSERLSLIGPPDAQDAQVGFQQLQTLIFCRQRLDWSSGESLRKAVDALPTTRPELMRVVAACEAAERIEPLATARFSLPTFIEAAQKIPTSGVTGFVDRLLGEPTRTNKTIRSIFCSGTVAYWGGRLRGLFPTYGYDEGHAAYAEEIRQKIKTIT